MGAPLLLTQPRQRSNDEQPRNRRWESNPRGQGPNLVDILVLHFCFGARPQARTRLRHLNISCSFAKTIKLVPARNHLIPKATLSTIRIEPARWAALSGDFFAQSRTAFANCLKNAYTSFPNCLASFRHFASSLSIRDLVPRLALERDDRRLPDALLTTVGKAIASIRWLISYSG